MEAVLEHLTAEVQHVAAELKKTLEEWEKAAGNTALHDILKADYERLKAKKAWLDEQRVKALEAKLQGTGKADRGGEPAGLTVFKWLHQGLQQLLTERTSRSKTRPIKRSRTFEQLRKWPEFTSGVEEMLCQLQAEHSDLRLAKLVRSIKGATTVSYTAADEVDVRGLLMAGVLHYINQVANLLGMRAEYQGNGSNRAASFTDIILRHAATTKADHLSSLILAVVEVKGNWQVDLPDNTNLVDALQDAGLRDKFLPALQQVYGDAVLDEAPLLILTTYDLTYFMRRSSDVHNNTLWVSDPVPWHGSPRVPAMAAWLYMLKLADTEMWPKHQKIPLPVMEVGKTAKSGYSIAGAEKPVHMHAEWPAGSQSVGQHQQPERKRQKQQPGEFEQALDGDGACPVSTGEASTFSDDGTATSVGASWSSAAWLQTVATAGPAAALEALPELTYQHMGYTDHCLSSTRHNRVFKGAFSGHPAALKVYDPESDAAVACFTQEATAYLQLHHLQGTCIPRLLALGQLAFTGAPVLVLQWADEMPQPCVEECWGTAARLALSQLHKAGAAHGDVCPDNLLVDGRVVFLTDLETCVVGASQQEMEADQQQLEACFEL